MNKFYKWNTIFVEYFNDYTWGTDFQVMEYTKHRAVSNYPCMYLYIKGIHNIRPSNFVFKSINDEDAAAWEWKVERFCVSNLYS